VNKALASFVVHPERIVVPLRTPTRGRVVHWLGNYQKL
jgi:hypothetical protein